jgi:hypothetical protein
VSQENARIVRPSVKSQVLAAGGLTLLGAVGAVFLAAGPNRSPIGAVACLASFACMGIWQARARSIVIDGDTVTVHSGFRRQTVPRHAVARVIRPRIRITRQPGTLVFLGVNDVRLAFCPGVWDEGTVQEIRRLVGIREG